MIKSGMKINLVNRSASTKNHNIEDMVCQLAKLLIVRKASIATSD